MAKSLGEIRKDEITDAVLQILVEQGPNALNARTVAEQVGMAKSSLYQHFASVDEMTLAALDKLHDRIMEMILTAKRHAETPLDELRLVAVALPRMAPLFAVLPKLKFQSTTLPEDWCETFHGHKIWFKDLLTDTMVRLQAAGQARTDITPLDLLHVFGGLFREILFMWKERENDPEFDGSAIIKQTWNLFETLIRPGQEAGTYAGPERRQP